MPDAQKGVSSSAVANKGLVQKLEELEVAFSTAKVEWAREKRQIMSAHAQEIQELNMLSREQVSEGAGGQQLRPVRRVTPCHGCLLVWS